jgi:hypothetical protein
VPADEFEKMMATMLREIGPASVQDDMSDTIMIRALRKI